MITSCDGAPHFGPHPTEGDLMFCPIVAACPWLPEGWFPVNAVPARPDRAAVLSWLDWALEQTARAAERPRVEVPLMVKGTAAPGSLNMDAIRAMMRLVAEDGRLDLPQEAWRFALNAELWLEALCPPGRGDFPRPPAEHHAQAVLTYLREAKRWLRGLPEADTRTARPPDPGEAAASAPSPPSASNKGKRSTEPGEARAKLVAEWPVKPESLEAEALESLLLLGAMPGGGLVASKSAVAEKAVGQKNKGTSYRRALDNLRARGLVESEARGFRLTERGLAEAQRLSEQNQARP
jgi:hypothetical protein